MAPMRANGVSGALVVQPGQLVNVTVQVFGADLVVGAHRHAREMGKAGEVKIDGVAYPRMQLLTVPELLTGQRFRTPKAFTITPII